MMTTRRTLLAGIFGLLAGVTALHSVAAPPAYPSQPIRVILPLSAGSTTDTLARRFAERLSDRLGQAVVVDNRPGAGGTVAAQAVARAAPDGYTLLLVNSQHAINPATYATLPYDTMRDFAGIALVGEAPSVIAVPRELGVNNMSDFIALVKSKPASMNFGSSGRGSQTHMAAAYFANQAGLSMIHVPYRAAPDALTDLITNRIQMIAAPAAFLQAQIQDGRLVALAMTGRVRLSTMPNVPTVNEAGLPGFEFSTWFGFIAPAKTPPQILETLATAFQSIAEEPALRQKMTEMGVTTRVVTLRDFDAYIKYEIDRLDPIVKSSGMREQ